MNKLLIPLSCMVIGGSFALGWTLNDATRPQPEPKAVKKLESPENGAYVVSVVSIHDGDTFSFNLPGLTPELNPLSIRLRGVDTPERGGKAKCESERLAAEKSREFTKSLIHETGDRILIKNLKWDKYGGRVDADVYVGNGYHELLTDRVIRSGNGRPYEGKKRIGWCGK